MTSAAPPDRLVVFEAEGHRWAFMMDVVTRIVDAPQRARVAAMPFEIRSAERALALAGEGEELFVVVERDIAVMSAAVLSLPAWLRPLGLQQGWLGIAFAANEEEAERAPIIVLDHRRLQVRTPPSGPGGAERTEP